MVGVCGAGFGACLGVVSMSTSSETNDAGSESVDDDGEGARALTPEEALDATTWRVLRQAMLIALVRQTGRKTTDYSPAEQNAMLEGLEPHMVSLHGMLREVGKQFYILGLQRVSHDLHAQPGVDNEALAEAVEFHTNHGDTGDDPPILLE